MKKMIIFIFIISFTFSIFANDDFITKKYQSIAIGELSLAYRLISLSASLSISNAAPKESIIPLLQNVENTMKNCSEIIKKNSNSAFDKEIINSISEVTSCLNQVKKYTSKKSYENYNKIKKCMMTSEDLINNLSEKFNKLQNKKTSKTNCKTENGNACPVFTKQPSK